MTSWFIVKYLVNGEVLAQKQVSYGKAHTPAQVAKDVLSEVRAKTQQSFGILEVSNEYGKILGRFTPMKDGWRLKSL